MATNTALTETIEVNIENLIILTKLDDKIDRLTEGVAGRVEGDINAMPAAVFNQYKALVVSVFNAEKLKSIIRGIIFERYDAIKFNEIAGFLNSAQIKFMNQLEEDSKTPEAINQMQKFFDGLQSSPPTEERKRLIEKIDSIKNFSSTVIDTQIDFFKAISWGMRGFRTDDQQVAEAALNQNVLDMRKQMTPHIERQVWTGMLYAYKDLSYDDLDTYISLSETAAGQLTTEFIQSVYQSMYKKVVDRLQSELEAAFTNN